MNIRFQQFNKLYDEYINDDNLIILILTIHQQLLIYQINKEDIDYFINQLKNIYPEYKTNTKELLEGFIKNNNQLIIHTPSEKYYINHNINLTLNNSIQDLLNHYNSIYEVIDNYKKYLKEKYLNKKVIEKTKVYRHTKLLI